MTSSSVAFSGLILQRSPSPDYVYHTLDRIIQSTKKHHHECHYKKCNIQNLNVRVYYDGSTKKYGVVCQPFIKPQPWMNDSTFHSEIHTLFICMDTGKVYSCHENCNGGRISNEDNCQVCCVSGLQYEAESVRSWEITSRCVATIAQEKGDPHKFSRGKDGRVNFTGVHNLKITQCMKATYNAIFTLLFSKKRFQSERYKMNETQKEAEKLVGKYRRHCEKNKMIKNYMHMITIYKNRLNRKNHYLHLIQIGEEQQAKILEEYTVKVITYWKMVLEKTPLGIDSPSIFSFKSFTPSCIYLMKSGMKMNGIYIIEPHEYLDCALPEANTLDYYSFNKPSFTATKNNITKAIRDAIECQVETPQSLNHFCKLEMEKNKKNYRSMDITI